MITSSLPLTLSLMLLGKMSPSLLPNGTIIEYRAWWLHKFKYSFDGNCFRNSIEDWVNNSSWVQGWILAELITFPKILSGLMCLQLKKIFRSVPTETPIADLKIMQKNYCQWTLSRCRSVFRFSSVAKPFWRWLPTNAMCTKKITYWHT